jgi:plasmid maintenance system antidote protein VapI
MTSATTVHDASSTPMRISDSGEISGTQKAVSWTDAESSLVYPLVVCGYHKTPPRNNFVSIDDVVAEHANDPARQAALKEARRWLVETFHNGEIDSLRALRLSKGMSQSELATKIGSTQAHIARIEAGANVQVDTLLRLAEALGEQPELIFRLHIKHFRLAA